MNASVENHPRPGQSSRAVLLDLGNVLVQFDHRIAMDALARLAGCTADRVRQAVFDSGLQREFELGKLTSREFATEVRAALGCTAQDAEILHAYSDIFRPLPGIEQVLERLRSERVPVGILSNTCPAHWETIERSGWDLFRFPFSPRILSFQVGAMKPDEAIYCEAERLCGCRGRQVFYTDDIMENVEAACRRGWRAVLFRNPQQLLAALEDWLQST